MKNTLAITLLCSCAALTACGSDSGSAVDPEAANAKTAKAAPIPDSKPSSIGISQSDDAVTNAQQAGDKKRKKD